MIANGLLLPFLALQIYYHPLIWIAALWAITFPGVTNLSRSCFDEIRTDSGTNSRSRVPFSQSPVFKLFSC